MTAMHRLRTIVLSRGPGLLVLALVVGAVSYLLVFRAQYYAPAALARSAGANAWINRGFSVAIVWPTRLAGSYSLIEGVQLALEHINQRQGPLAGKITLRIYNETNDKGAIARTVAAQEDVIAVIGHELDGTTVPASITYHVHGILFFAPESTDIRLTGHQFPYVFRLTPDDRDMTAALASFALRQNWKRLGILYARSEHGESASSRFVTAAGTTGIQIPFMRSYFNTADYRTQDFRQMLAEVREYQFDAFALAGDLPWGAKLIKDMRQMGVPQPLLATDKLDSSQVAVISERAADNLLYVASAVDPDSTEPRFVEFREKFRAKYGSNPGYGSSQGYESLMLLANAIEKSGSADPVVVATTLKTNEWDGLFGKVRFDQKGDVVGRHVSIKRMLNGEFHTVSHIIEENQ